MAGIDAAEAETHHRRARKGSPVLMPTSGSGNDTGWEKENLSRRESIFYYFFSMIITDSEELANV